MSSSLILSSNDININFFDERVNIEPSSKIIIEENIDPKNGIRCPQCYLIPQIFLQYEKAPNIECNCEIPHTKYATIIYKCENGHSQKVSLSYFLTHSKDYGIYDCICANNENHNQNDNRDIIYRFCFICKKFFCPDCFNATQKDNPGMSLDLPDAEWKRLKDLFPQLVKEDEMRECVFNTLQERIGCVIDEKLGHSAKTVIVHDMLEPFV